MPASNAPALKGNAIKNKLAKMIMANRVDGTYACGKLMDTFGIRRCPENYLTIVGILREYRRDLRRLLK